MRRSDDQSIPTASGLGSALNTTTPVQTFYVDSVSGSDSSPGTAALPVASVTGLARIFPRLRTGPVVVHLAAAGNYPNFRLPPSQAMNAACPVYVIGDTSTTVATGVAGAASTALSINATVASKDLYQGMTLRMTSGAAATGRKVHIRNCTAGAPGTIVPAWQLAATPATSDTFAIETPSCVITYTDSYTFAEGIGFGQIDSPLVLVNLMFQGPTRAAQTPTHVVRIARCSVVMFGVSTQVGGSVQLVDSYAHAGTLHAAGASQQLRLGNAPPIGNNQVFSTAINALPDLGVDPWLYQGWGMSSPFANAQTCPFLLDRSAFVGCVCAGAVNVTSGSDCVLVGGGLVTNSTGGGTLYVAGGGRLFVLGALVQRLAQVGSVVAPGNIFWTDTNTSGANLQVEAGGFAEISDLVTNSAATGSSTAVTTVKGEVRLTSTLGGTGSLSGTFAGGCIGVFVSRGGRFTVDAGTVAFTYSGTAGSALEISSWGLVTGLDSLIAANGRLVAGSGAKVVCTQGLPVTWTLLSISASNTEIDLAQAGTSVITLNNGASGICLTLDYGARMFAANCRFIFTGQGVIDNGSSLSQGGAVNTSTWTASASPTLSVAANCAANFLKATSGTLTITNTNTNGKAVVCQGDLSFDNARFATVAAGPTTGTGVDFSRGGQVRCVAQPTNVTGLTQDFLDEQGGFADTLLNAQTFVATGQHPAGAYVLGYPTGSGFVQRLS